MRFSPYYIPVILGLTMAVPAITPAVAQVAVGITVGIAPPPIPVYVQPPIPEEGYLWTPGYWAYEEAGGYYWVPGTWVRPPSVGVLWTPPYWGFVGGVYGFNAGYWGPHVGFYGGVNYGFGFGGVGFVGATWNGGSLSYNRSVNNFGNTHITNVYNKTVINNRPGGAAFNGAGGVQARPTPEEEAAAKEQHVEPTAEQKSHFEAAKSNPELRASANHGKPAIAATAKPGDFKGPGVVPAKAAGPGAEHSAAVRAPGAAEAKEKAGEKPEAGAKPEPKAKAEAGMKPEGEKPAAAKRAPAHKAPAERPEGAPAPHPAAHRAAPHPAAPHPAAPRPAAAPHPAAPHPAPAAKKEEK